MGLSLTDTALLSATQIDKALSQQRQGGGSALRVLEIALEQDELNALWKRTADTLNRNFYASSFEIGTLEEACPGPDGILKPILSREAALTNLTLAQRQEGTNLLLLTVDPYFQEEPVELLTRAKQINAFGIGHLKYSVIPPELFRRCMDFAYPPQIYGPMSLHESLALKGLVSLRELMAYSDLEDAVNDGLIREQDYVACVARQIELPQYDGRPPTLTESLIPRSLEEQQLLYSHSIDDTGTLVILTASSPSPNLTTQLSRFSARPVRYELTTSEMIATLRRHYGPYTD